MTLCDSLKNLNYNWNELQQYMIENREKMLLLLHKQVWEN